MAFFFKHRFVIVLTLLLILSLSLGAVYTLSFRPINLKTTEFLSPLEGDILADKAEKSFNQGHYEVAEAEFELALEKDRRYHPQEDVLVWLAQVYQKLNLNDKAIRAYHDALTINPEFLLAWVGQGILYRQMRKFDLAEASYLQALKLAPNDPHIITSLGALAASKKDFETAIDLFEESIRIDPQLAVSYGNLSFTYAEMGDLKNAQKYLDLAEKRGFTQSQALVKKLESVSLKNKPHH